jgi:hypothetical protein
MSEVIAEKETEKQNKKTPLLIEKGLVEMKTLEDQYRLAQMYLASKVLPDRFKTPEQIVTALHFVREHFPNTPLTALRQTAVIEGSPCFYGDLPLALVQRSGLLEEMKESFEGDMRTDDSKAVCIVKRKSLSEVRREFSVGDAKRAGLWSRGTYSKYPQRMLQMRARSWALKDGFADILAGIGVLEYDHHAVVEEEKIVGEIGSTKANDLTDKYSTKPEATNGKEQQAEK